MPGLCIRVLGRPILELDGVDQTGSLSIRAQALLFYVATQAHPVARPRLAKLLWSELEEPVARANLRVTLTRIRRRLPGLLDIDARQVGLLNPSVPGLHTDLAELEAVLAAGCSVMAGIDHERCLRAAQAWRGPFMDGFDSSVGEEYEHWLLRMRQRTDRLITTLRQGLARHAEALGTPAGRQEAIGHIRALLDVDEADEPAHMLLMRLLAETGQRSAAIAQYEVCKAALAQRLGARPSADCYALYTRIHAADDRHAGTGTEARALAGPVLPPAVTVALRDAHLSGAFVGRVAELAWLQAAASGASLLIGEAGLGKTRLLAQAWPQAARLQGRETLAQLPLHPLIELLRAQRVSLAPRLNAWLTELARLVPEYAADPPPPFDPVLGKPRLFEALCRAMDLLGAPVIIDDLQWVDPLTLEWLGYGVVQRQMAVVLARRPEVSSPELKGLERMLEHAGLLRTRQLSALDEATLETLLRSRPDRPGPLSNPSTLPASGIDAAALARIVQRAAGNPFFALELWRWHGGEPGGDVREERDAGRGAGHRVGLAVRAVDRSVGRAVPPRVAQVISERMAWLPEAAQRVLGLLAVAADAGLPGVTLAALVGMAPDDFDRACDRLEKEGFLDGDALAHDLLREAVLQTLPPRRLRQWHAEVATALEQSGRTIGPAGPERVALHWRAAGQAQRALVSELHAAQAWRQLGALEESTERFRSIAEQAQDPLLRMRARAAVAEHLLLSDLAAGRQALQALLVETAGLPPSPQRQALRVRLHTGLADNAIYRGDLLDAAAHVDTVLPLLDEADPVERQHALEIVMDVSTRRGDFEQARDALARARRENPGNVTWEVYAAMLAWSEVRLDEAIAGFARVLSEHPGHARYVMVENDYAVALSVRGDVTAAEHWLRRGLTTWAGVSHAQCLSRMNLGAVLTSLGRAEEAAAELHAARQLAVDQHSRLFEGECLYRLGRLQLQCGLQQQARQSISLALACLSVGQDPARVAQWWAFAATAALADGALQVARQFMVQALGVPEALCRPLASARVLRAQVVLALEELDPALARSHADRLVEMAERWGMDEVLVDALLLSARCVQLTGGSAVATLARAHSLAEHRGLRPLQWRARVLADPIDPATLALAQALRMSAGPFGWDADRLRPPATVW